MTATIRRLFAHEWHSGPYGWECWICHAFVLPGEGMPALGCDPDGDAA